MALATLEQAIQTTTTSERRTQTCKTSSTSRVVPSIIDILSLRRIAHLRLALWRITLLRIALWWVARLLVVVVLVAALGRIVGLLRLIWVAAVGWGWGTVFICHCCGVVEGLALKEVGGVRCV